MEMTPDEAERRLDELARLVDPQRTERCDELQEARTVDGKLASGARLEGAALPRISLAHLSSRVARRR
jgi:hypothetical protein